LGERKTKITILAEGERAAKTVRVSKSWYQQTKRATQVKESVKNALKGRSDVHTIGIRSDDRTIGGLRAEAVDVQVDPDGSLDGIPSSMDGVPVVAEKSERPKQTGCSDCYCEYHDEVYGGLTYTTDYWDGTFACRVKKDGNKYLLGARHVFIEKEEKGYCEDSTDTDVWSRADHIDTIFGVADSYYPDHDAALLKLDDNADESISADMVGSGSRDGVVVGRVTGAGLDYLNSKDSTVQKRGRSTCFESGHIKKIEQEIGCGWFDSQTIQGIVRSTPDQEKGDSGGPVYYEEPQSSGADKIYIVNMATHEKNTDAQGPSADDMFDNYGFWYGGEPYDGS
jgi:hypothetical protein